MIDEQAPSSASPEEPVPASEQIHGLEIQIAAMGERIAQLDAEIAVLRRFTGVARQLRNALLTQDEPYDDGQRRCD